MAIKFKYFSDRDIKLSYNDEYTFKVTIDSDGKLVKVLAKEYNHPDNEFIEVDAPQKGLKISMDELEDVMKDSAFIHKVKTKIENKEFSNKVSDKLGEALDGMLQEFAQETGQVTYQDIIKYAEKIADSNKNEKLKYHLNKWNEYIENGQDDKALKKSDDIRAMIVGQKEFSNTGYLVYHEIGESKSQEGYQITTEDEFKRLKKSAKLNDDLSFKKDYGPDSYQSCQNWIKGREKEFSRTDLTEVSFKTSNPKQLTEIVKAIGQIGNPGHYFTIVLDPDNSDSRTEFTWDGDGSDYIDLDEIKEFSSKSRKLRRFSDDKMLFVEYEDEDGDVTRQVMKESDFDKVKAEARINRASGAKLKILTEEVYDETNPKHKKYKDHPVTETKEFAEPTYKRAYFVIDKKTGEFPFHVAFESRIDAEEDASTMDGMKVVEGKFYTKDKEFSDDREQVPQYIADEVDKNGVIVKYKDSWRIVSKKQVPYEFWDAHYDTKEDAEAALAAYHANK